MDRSATADIAAFGGETPVTALPADVVEIARRAILDTIGVSLAGSVESAARIVTEQALSQSNRAECTVWGTGASVTAQLAALANGTAAHVLDYDDTHDSMRGHPSVTILPAVYAMGERTGASGMDVLAAFVVGLEVACKLGLHTGQAPYDHGWHVTATHGIVGATVGAGRLAGLTVEQLQHAIGMAVSFAGGVRGNFGSMTKSLHIGRLGQSAIMAVELAERGFTANPEAIEGDFGYWKVFGRDARFVDEPIGAQLGNPWEIIKPGLNVKAYPCCASTHAAIDIALEVRERLGQRRIERVTMSVPYTAPLLLIHHRPTDPLSAKFSLEYCVAAALLDGAVTLDTFTPESVAREDIQSLLRRVEYVIPPEWQHDDGIPKTGFARIDVHLTDGDTQHAETLAVRGSPARPLTVAELAEKFRACAGSALDGPAVDGLLNALQAIDRIPAIQQVSALLAPQREPHPVG